MFYGEPLYVCAQRETVGSAGELAATTLNACLPIYCTTADGGDGGTFVTTGQLLAN